MAILHFGHCQDPWSYFQHKKLFRTFVDTIFGHPVYRFPQKPEISDFTGSGFGFPCGHRLWKYVSLCLTNSYFMTNALRRREPDGNRVNNSNNSLTIGYP